MGLALSVPRLLPPGTVTSRRGLPSVILSRGLLNGAFNGSITFVPLMLVRERGMDLPTAGAVLAIASLGWSAGAWVQGQVRGNRPLVRSRLVALGAALLAAGCAALAVLTAAGLPTWVVALATVPLGLGMGIGSTTLSVLVLDLSPLEEHGRASASLQLADVLGSVLGIAAATAIYGAFLASAERLGYVVLWTALAGVAATAVVTGRRCAVRSGFPPRERHCLPVLMGGQCLQGGLGASRPDRPPVRSAGQDVTAGRPQPGPAAVPVDLDRLSRRQEAQRVGREGGTGGDDRFGGGRRRPSSGRPRPALPPPGGIRRQGPRRRPTDRRGAATPRPTARTPSTAAPAAPDPSGRERIARPAPPRRP